MNLKSSPGEVSDGYEEPVTGNWKNANPCYKVTKNLAKLSSHVLWKVEFVGDELGYLVEGISKKNVEGMACILLTAYSKMWEERNNWKRNYQAKRNQWEDLKNSQLIHSCKKWSVLKKEHHRCVARQPPLKTSWVCDVWIQSTIPAEALQLGLRRNRVGMTWRKLVRPLEFHRQDMEWHSCLDVNTCHPLVTGKKDPKGGCHCTCPASKTVSFLVAEGLGLQLRAVREQHLWGRRATTLDGLEDRTFEPGRIIL